MIKLNLIAFALAFGIWWGVGLFIMTWWLIVSGVESPSLPFFEQLYVGYSVTPIGSLVGLVEGFICGVICGGILAWLYNVLADRIGAKR